MVSITYLLISVMQNNIASIFFFYLVGDKHFGTWIYIFPIIIYFSIIKDIKLCIKKLYQIIFYVLIYVI